MWARFTVLGVMAEQVMKWWKVGTFAELLFSFDWQKFIHFWFSNYCHYYQQTMQAIQKYLCIFVFTSMIISAELSMYIITHVHW